MANKINVIIPYYNTEEDVFEKCLHSIYEQTLINDLDITVVDDASTEPHYDNLVKGFNMLKDKIKVIKLEENSGPGVARQTGIDNTDAPYISFIDSDDVFSETHALEYLMRDFETNEKCVMSLSSFDEIILNPDGQIMHHFHPADNSWAWVHGKIYKRAYLEKHNIKFPIWSYSNEDCGFNNMCRIYSNEEEVCVYNQNCTYIWINNYESITKKNDFHYSFGLEKSSSLYGTLTNFEYIVGLIKEDIGVNQNMLDSICNYLADNYFVYCDFLKTKPENAGGAAKLLAKLYKNVYLPVKDQIDPQRLEAFVLNGLYSKVNSKMIQYVFPVSFYEYMDTLAKVAEEILEEE